MDVALQARIRHLGLADSKQAADPRRGYLLGRLFLADRITAAQHDAGTRYAEDAARYFGLVVGQFPSIRSRALFAAPGKAIDGAESEQRIRAVQNAATTMNALTAALRGADGTPAGGRRIERTVREIALLDLLQPVGWPEPALFLLKRGLSALAEHYRL